MATWHYIVHLIPRRKLVQLFSKIPDCLDRETFNSIDWWNHENICHDHESDISSFLKESQSWSENIKTWGDEDNDYVSLLFESGHIVEVEVRIDVRSLSRAFVENFCRFARVCDCLLLTEDSTVLEADVDLLLHQIGQSKAFAFVSDPVGFLDRLQRLRES